MLQKQSEGSRESSPSENWPDVPCDGCRLCCEGGNAALEPDDDPDKYRTYLVDGKECLARDPATNHCVYLGEAGCTIYHDRPKVCRRFDCRDLYEQIVTKINKDIHWADDTLRKVIDRGRSLHPDKENLSIPDYTNHSAILTTDVDGVHRVGSFDWLQQPRLLPNAMVIGAMRAGSTMLWESLNWHPQVATSSIKELNYWDKLVEEGVTIQSYARMFPSVRHLDHGRKIILEGSPGYMHHPPTMARIAQGLGQNVKMLAIIRDPVDRAVSHYKWLKRYNLMEDEGIERFKKAAGDKDEGYLYDKVDMIGETYSPAYHDLVARSVYDVQLRRVKAYFPHLMIVFHEEFMANQDSTYEELSVFLNIDKPTFKFPAYQDRENFDQFDLSEEDKEWLRKRLAPSVRRFEDEFGIQTPWGGKYER